MEATVPAANMPGFQGAIHGWSINQIEHPSIPGGPANILVAVAGWESLEASVASASAPGMNDCQATLSQFGGIVEVSHVSLTKA